MKKYCPHCEEKTIGGIWCGECSKAYDIDDARKTLGSLKFTNFTGGASTSPKVEKFWETGDPSVFAKPGAPDYQG
tara:strand:+ start:285 stop:509 length:225 start_codon:yes stop_codon:yes gene_type:complete